MGPFWITEDATLTGQDSESRAKREKWILQTLADKLGLHFQNLELVRPEGQKPWLKYEGRRRGDLSISHSGPWLGLVHVEQGIVGLDIERIRSMEKGSEIAKRYFTPLESEAIANAPAGPASDLLVLEAWTRREAALKAFGLPFGRISEVRHALSENQWMATHEEISVRISKLDGLPPGLIGAVAMA